ncbi:MAG: methyltransferase family protein [Stellaceae bacterium]
MFTNLLKSIGHNVGVVFVGLGLVWVGIRIDALLGIGEFHHWATAVVAWFLLATGLLLRVWATFDFYERRMKVISLVPQTALVMSGPYRFSRNPPYLGGNVFIFFGAALLFGSPAALVLTALYLPLMDCFIRREEAQLDRAFGADWRHYKAHVCRWL